MIGSLLEWLRAVVPADIKVYYWAALGIYTSPLFWGFTASILLLEKLRPAVPSQGVISRGLVQDFVWFNTDAAFKVALLPAAIGLLKLAYDGVTGGLVLAGLEGWPLGARIALGIVAFDFLQWFHHWVRHRVTVFWHFHAVHHAQRELNLFTDLRVHVVEYLVSDLLVFVPLFALNLPAYAIMGVGGARWWYTRFIHANIRTNLGPFKHLLVSPQFHRIHHSRDPVHQDRNFGVVLTVWDRMFGTLHRNYDEYPATGVEGLAFDPPATLAPWAWAADFGRQFIYPFQKVWGARPAPRSGSEPEGEEAAAHRDGDLLASVDQIGYRAGMDPVAGSEGP